MKRLETEDDGKKTITAGITLLALLSRTTGNKAQMKGPKGVDRPVRC